MMVTGTAGVGAGLLALASASMAAPHAPATATPLLAEGKPAASAAPSAPLLTLQESLALASGEQPALVAYEREAQASEQEAVAAQSLPDLQLTAGLQNFPITGMNAFSPTGDEMTMLTIGLMREQVRRSKRRAEAARLTAEALVSRQQGTARKREIRRDVMIAWIDAVEGIRRRRCSSTWSPTSAPGARSWKPGFRQGRRRRRSRCRWTARSRLRKESLPEHGAPR